MLAFCGSLFSQEIDSRKDRRAPAIAPMRWENHSSALQHVAGNQVVYSRQYRLNVVTLAPGQYVDFQVPTHEYIRVQSCSPQRINDGQTEIWTSNGTGLFRKLNAAQSENQLSLIGAPDQSGISIGRVLRSADAPSAITIAVFTSTRDPRRLLDYYQCSVIGNERRVKVSDDRARKPKFYTPIKSGKRYALEVDSNTRLRLETRLMYDSDSSQHQFYWVKVFIDGVYDHTLLFDTLPQRMHRQFVDGTEKLIGQREFAYLDIESQNQSIEVEVSHPVLLRANAIGLKLVNPVVNDRYNAPAWEAQLLDEDAWLEKDVLDDGRTFEDYLAQGVPQQTAQKNPFWDPWLNYPKLLGVARDNSIRFGGLRAYMWMRVIATRRQGESNFGDELTVGELAQRIRNRFTYFRDLLPIDLHGSTNPRFISFPVRSIRRPDQSATETIVGQQHVNESAARLATTTLFQISTGGWQAPNSDQPCQCGDLIYRPAEGLGASRMRVIVDRQTLTGDAKLLIQYDERPPFELNVIPTSALKLSAFVPGRSEAAVAGLAQTHARYDSGPWGGPYSTLDQPVAMVDAAVAEFPLPQSVKQVKISAQSASDQALHIGVQCLMANFTELSELAYRKYGKTVSTIPALKEFASWQLNNNSLDAQRLLQGHVSQINKGLAPNDSLKPSVLQWSQQQLEQHQSKAVEMAEAGNWHGALEVLTDLIAHSDGQDRVSSIVSRTEVLERMGEHYLASQERRGWLKFSKNADLKKAMLKKLVNETLATAGGESSEELVRAFASVQIGDQESEVKFAQRLADNGRYRFALLTIPPTANGAEVDEMVLRCSFQLGWWKTFKEALKRMENVERRNFWGAMKAMQIGQYKRAFRLFAAAGEEGQRWLKHWKYGDYIFGRLGSTELLTRMSAIEDWESWLEKHPGQRQWRPENSSIVSSQGAATLYSVERDLRMEFRRCDEDNVSTVRVHGPAHIRIECRPLHTADQQNRWRFGQRPEDQSLNGVLEINNGQQIERLPILGNIPSDTLVIDGLRHLYQPGRRVFADLQIPAGLNELKLTAKDMDLLFRVHVQRPEIRSPVLPPITETTLSAVVIGKFGARCELLGQAHDEAIGTDSVRLVSREQQGKSIDHPFRQYYGGELDLETLRPYLKDQLGDIPTWQNRIFPTPSPFVLLHQDDVYKQAISIVYDNREGPIATRDLPLDKIARLETLQQSNPTHRSLARLISQLKKGSTWVRFEQFDQRAGVYLEKVDRWRPGSPATRARKALMSVQRADRALIGAEPVEIDLTNIFAPELEFRIARPRVGFVPTLETVVNWEFNGQQKSVTLDADQQTETFRIKLTAGIDRITFWQPQPYANHFVVINANEVLPDGTVSDTSVSAIGPDTRAWHVATTEEPLTFTAPGPNLFRIDQLVDDQIQTRIAVIQEASKPFRLAPEEGNRVARFRIFKLEKAPVTSPIYRPTLKTQSSDDHWVHDAVDEVMQAVQREPIGESLELLSLRGPDADSEVVKISDPTLLGVYDSGTTGFHFGYQRRRVIEELPTQQQPGRFFELGISNRKFDPWRDEYRQTDLILRPRIGSGPTLGASHQRTKTLGAVNQRWDNSADGQGPLQLNWRVYAFGQHAGTPLREPAHSFPWTAGFSGRLSRAYQLTPTISHRPSVGIFGRYLSETQDGFADGELDRDIFTTFKRNHRYGLRLSDQFVYQCHEDRRFYFRPTLSSNEDQLVPDNVGFSVGADQLFGPVQLHVGYRITGFLSDNDRTDTAIQNVLRIDLKTEKWDFAGFRSEVDLSVIHEISGGTSVGINFSRFFNDSRLYRDFRPGSVLFRPLKQQRAVQIDSR